MFFVMKFGIYLGFILIFLGVTPTVSSKPTKSKWSKDCQTDFQQFTVDRTLVAKVTSGETSHSFSGDSRVLVQLYDTSDPTKDVSIADELIAKNYAVSKSS